MQMRSLFKKKPSKDGRGLAGTKDLDYNSSGELSTFSVSIPKNVAALSSPAAEIKRVRFSMSIEASKVAANSNCSKACWLMAQDLAQTKQDVDALVQGLSKKKEERLFIAALSEIYETCCSVEDESLIETGFLEPLEEKDLIEGVRDCQSFGLAGTVVEALEQNYLSRRKQMKRTLRQVQKSLPDCELRVESIRKNMEDFTRPFRLLAREIGKATEAAVSQL